ncbi:hypothetical protein [Mucilaginibacter dorajii]|uniref:Uncharacterized protein n=1 Tax=Mucilaginibacter dorajii TaxID=692994 RepID=A0ABP7R3C1_9SPHI|nr:hypothetical protein [Mucilaginibacter dorajii]MCS3738001.1 hypothetical protein [Mucilaginibacter dorajii]
MINKQQEFEETMARQKTDKLLDIINSEAGIYDPLAVQAANNELIARNLSDDEIKMIEAEIAEKMEEFEARKYAPLDLGYKILCIILPGTIPLTLAAGFKADGYHQKAKDSLRWTFYGFAFYISVVILGNIF